MKQELAQAVKAKAHELGFDLVGITGAEPSAFAAEYRDWIARGCAGEMDYLTRNVERRLDPRELLPDARSIIVVGMNYYTDPGTECAPGEGLPDSITGAGNSDDAPEAGEPTGFELRDANPPLPPIKNQKSKIENEAVFARYARGDDYHDVMTVRLRDLLGFLKAESGEGTEGRVYVDAGPVLEREVARRAGLGWFGKNTMLINTRRGSYFFLGEIVTNVALPVDAPAVGGCGTCTRCLDACPTGAIVDPYQVDARRCISYLTIEIKGAIPEDLRPALAASGNRIFGCDICQEVCPFNRPAAASAHPTLAPTQEPAFQPRKVTSNSTLVDLLLMDEEEFRANFKGSPVKRAKRRGLLRNVATALAASGDPEAMHALERAATSDPEPLVREQAKWELESIRQRKPG